MVNEAILRLKRGKQHMPSHSQHTISSSRYKITINSLGAELSGLYWKSSRHNWIWNGESWKRHAPVLFPIVGRLKGDSYTVDGKTYELSQHGFARDTEFSVVESDSRSITFKMTSSEQTLAKYPYQFEFFVRYEVSDDDVAVSFRVRSEREIFFSCGWHPAFSFPNQESLLGNMQVTGASSDFSYQLLNAEGLIEPLITDETAPLVVQGSTFQKDALIFINGLGDLVELSSKKAGVRISMHTGGASQFGIWSKNPAEFVCLEPWWGCADLLEASQNDLPSKFGIQHVVPSQEWSRTVRLSLLQWNK